MHSDYKSDLMKLFEQTKVSAIEKFLLENSNLPGQRANLGLASCFADFFGRDNLGKSNISMLDSWSSMSATDAPVNNPKEFLPFCAIQAFGALYSHADLHRKNAILKLLKQSANDERWRMRESVAMAFQRIAENNLSTIEEIFSSWLKQKTTGAEKRAILVALAHPCVLKGNKKHVKYCLQISDAILTEISTYKDSQCRTDDFLILLKGLEFTVSVFIAQLPVEGFDLITNYANSKNKYIIRIIKSNLSKERLKKSYSAQVDDVLRIIT